MQTEQLYNNDTICAIATANGGAIGILRISGGQAIATVNRFFVPAHGKPLSVRASHTLTYGKLLTPQGETLDEVVAALYRAPHSYTGEETVELMCHSSAYILQQAMQQLIDAGCRSAQPGEFTQRAFLNGKMDLSQAEAVADLIASSSAATHRLAMSQMRGDFSRELSVLRNKLLHFNALIELELDFSDHEELTFADRDELTALSDEIEAVIARLAHSFKVGNAIKQGIPVAIIGATNAGKSTLLNALLHEERAIVSAIHGTTRDVIEDTIQIHGVTFRFIDTAGIRHTQDEIEQLGIERTYQKLAQATIVLWIVDCTTPLYEIETLRQAIVPKCEGKTLIVLFNKCELLSNHTPLHEAFATLPHRFISAQTKQLSSLEDDLVRAAALPDISNNNVIVTNARHYEALCHALEAIHRVQDGLKQQITNDLLSEDLHLCLMHLGDIVANGSITSEETLQFIFSHFCIGK